MAALADVTFAQKCVPHGWWGMEFLIGIPGTIGGAIAMNAGAHGAETADFIEEVEWDGYGREFIFHALRETGIPLSFL